MSNYQDSIHSTDAIITSSPNYKMPSLAEQQQLTEVVEFVKTDPFFNSPANPCLNSSPDPKAKNGCTQSRRINVRCSEPVYQRLIEIAYKKKMTKTQVIASLILNDHNLGNSYTEEEILRLVADAYHSQEKDKEEIFNQLLYIQQLLEKKHNRPESQNEILHEQYMELSDILRTLNFCIEGSIKSRERLYDMAYSRLHPDTILF